MEFALTILHSCLILLPSITFGASEQTPCPGGPRTHGRIGVMYPRRSIRPWIESGQPAPSSLLRALHFCRATWTHSSPTRSVDYAASGRFRDAQAQSTPRFDGSPILPDRTVLPPETSGGFRPVGARRSEKHKTLTLSRHPRSRRSHLQASTRARKGFVPRRRPAPPWVAHSRVEAAAAVRWGGLGLLLAALSRSPDDPEQQALSARGSLPVRREHPRRAREAPPIRMPRMPRVHRLRWVCRRSPAVRTVQHAGSILKPSRQPIPAESGEPNSGEPWPPEFSGGTQRTWHSGGPRRRIVQLDIVRCRRAGQRVLGVRSIHFEHLSAGTVAIPVGLGQPLPNRGSVPSSSSLAGSSTTIGSSGRNRRTGSAAAMIAPVGGGNGGIFAQAWRYQQSPPDSAPYSSGPVAGSTAAARSIP